MKKNFYSTEEILEMLENMNDDSENEEQTKEEFDILMEEVFAFVMDMAKEKLASPGDEIHLSYRVQVISDSALVAITLMIAESRPEEKETMVKLVMNFLSKQNTHD